MPSSYVTGVYGSLGCGKSLFAVSVIARELKYNPKHTYVTSNITLNKTALSTYCGYDVSPYITYVDLNSCGFSFREGTLRGRKGLDKSIIVFDEIAEFFNQWSSASPRVQSFLSWLRHSSKKGQSVYILVQSPTFVNKDIRLLCFRWVCCCGYKFIPAPFCYLFFWLPFCYIRQYDNKGQPILYSGRFVSWELYGQFYDTAQAISKYIDYVEPDFKPYKPSYKFFFFVVVFFWSLIWFYFV